MKSRAKRAFPAVAAQARERKIGSTYSSKATVTPKQALAEFDRVVGLAAEGANDEAERILEGKSPAHLRVMAKELGMSFSMSRRSFGKIREAIFGKVRESVLLSRHNRRA